MFLGILDAWARVSPCAGVAVGCGNFLYFSAHFRSFPSVGLIQAGGRLFAGAWYGDGFETSPYMPGTRLGGCRTGAGFCIFAGITGHLRALGSRLCGSGGWVRNFYFPAHFRSFPSVGPIQAGGRLFSGAWYEDGFQTRPYMPVARFGGCRPGAGFCFFPSITGHFRALGSCLCGSGGWVRIFYFPAHFRSFPSVGLVPAMGWAGSSFSGRPG